MGMTAAALVVDLPCDGGHQPVCSTGTTTRFPRSI